MTSSEVKRSRNLAEKWKFGVTWEKSTRCFRTDVFASSRQKINRNDPDENISWNLWPFTADFFELTITKNGAVSKTLFLKLQMNYPHSTRPDRYCYAPWRQFRCKVRQVYRQSSSLSSLGYTHFQRQFTDRDSPHLSRLSVLSTFNSHS